MPLRRSSARYRVGFLGAALRARITYNPQQSVCLHARPSMTAELGSTCMRITACVRLQVADRVVRGGGLSKSKAAEGAVAAVHEHFSHPNVLVAHLQEGIEVIHLYTGRSRHAEPTLSLSVVIPLHAALWGARARVRTRAQQVCMLQVVPYASCTCPPRGYTPT